MDKNEIDDYDMEENFQDIPHNMRDPGWIRKAVKYIIRRTVPTQFPRAYPGRK